MSTTQTQLRRGTYAQNQAMTPAEGEVIVDLTNDRLGLGDGLTAGGKPQASAADVQGNEFTYLTVSGTNTLTASPFPDIGSYSEGQGFQFKAAGNNTGAVSLNINGKGAINLRKDVNGTLTPLVADDLRVGIIYDVIYNGTTFQVLNIAAPAASPGSVELLSTKTGGGASIEFLGLFSTAYSSYKFVFKDISLNTASRTVSFQVRVGGVWQTASLYSRELYGSTASITTTSMPLSQPMSNNSQSASGQVDVILGSFVAADASSRSEATPATFGAIGGAPLTGVDGIRFGNASMTGTINGTISMYGYKA